MTSKKPTPITLTETVSRETLDATPTRALALLRGAGTVPVIRHALEARGYTDAVHSHGWSLLHAASGYGGVGIQVSLDADVREAISAIDAWHHDGVRTLNAAWKNRYPSQAKFALEGISASSNGALAVVDVTLLLERLDHLESGKDRKATHVQDRAALAVLAERGIDAAKRKELAALVARAQAPADTSELVTAQDAADREAAHLQALVELRVWFEEWSEIAKVVVTRRDYLIRLGLAKRKTGKAAPAEIASASAPAAGGSGAAK